MGCHLRGCRLPAGAHEEGVCSAVPIGAVATGAAGLKGWAMLTAKPPWTPPAYLLLVVLRCMPPASVPIPRRSATRSSNRHTWIHVDFGRTRRGRATTACGRNAGADRVQRDHSRARKWLQQAVRATAATPPRCKLSIINSLGKVNFHSVWTAGPCFCLRNIVPCFRDGSMRRAPKKR